MPNKLKGYRVMAGYTQKDMAEALGISLRVFLEKENGKKEFTVEEAKKITSLLKNKIESIEFNDIFLN